MIGSEILIKQRKKLKKKKIGRPSKLSKKLEKKIKIELNKEKAMNLRMIKKACGKEGAKVSKSSFYRYLKQLKASYQNVKTTPLLLNSYIKKRYNFSKFIKEHNDLNIIFIDETTIKLFPYLKKAWSLKGQRKEVIQIKYPAKLQIWGCFSNLGFGSLFIFKENLDSKLMLKIYKKQLLKSAKKWFGNNFKSWFLLEDNDLKYKARICKEFKETNQIQVLDFPPNSPDLNPIENVWCNLKSKLNEKKYY